jgi:antirestriction protein ArdC
MRFYTVFNVSQCEGLKLPGPSKPDVTAPVAPPVTMQEAYAALGAVVNHGGDRAYYAPGPDYVQMPEPAAFTEPDAYAATALHELTHWTGHESRLARDFNNRFGTKAYAAEELVAEFGAAFLCAALGINSALEHHASYLKHWHELLTAEPKALITATSKAQAAADFILSKVRPETAGAEEEDNDSGEEGAALPIAA